MPRDEYSREPCPLSVVQSYGCGFALGLIGGSLFHGIKGFRDAPSGINKRFIGSLTAVKTRSPRSALSFAIWCSMIESFNCTIKYFRQKDDPWNRTISGAATGAVLASRNGVCAMATGAISTGLAVGLVEIADMFMTRLDAEPWKPRSTTH